MSLGDAAVAVFVVACEVISGPRGRRRLGIEKVDMAKIPPVHG